MGVKSASRHGGGSIEFLDTPSTQPDHVTCSSSGATCSGGRVADKQVISRRKGTEKSILDDIMGDPDDFTDLADPDAGSEDDGGRWEDTIREALENNGASKGIQPEDRIAEDDDEKDFGENASANNLAVRSPGALQNGKEGKRPSLTSRVEVNGTLKQQKTHATRYFIIKSLSHRNISKSVEKGIWATQAMNEPVLNEAFETAENVLLVFSVNMSGHFQGYARMTSPIGQRKANVWSEAHDGANPWGGTFAVEWLRLYELPFQKTLHLRNPLNYFKPVKISRDCQELTPEIGEALCALIDEGAGIEERPKRKVSPGDANGSKRSRADSSGGVPDRSHRAQGSTISSNGLPYSSPQLQPSMAHDAYVQATTRSAGGFIGKSSGSFESPKVRSPQKSTDREREKDKDRHKHREERGIDKSDLPPEEDLLNMSYEEYLQRHGQRDYQQAAGQYPSYPSGSVYGGSWATGMGYPDDQYTNYLASWYSNRQGHMMSADTFYGMQGMGYAGTRAPDLHWHGKQS